MREAGAEQGENNNSQVIQRIGSLGAGREEESLPSDDSICFPRHFWSFVFTWSSETDIPRLLKTGV